MGDVVVPGAQFVHTHIVSEVFNHEGLNAVCPYDLMMVLMWRVMCLASKLSKYLGLGSSMLPSTSLDRSSLSMSSSLPYIAGIREIPRRAMIRWCPSIPFCGYGFLPSLAINATHKQT